MEYGEFVAFRVPALQLCPGSGHSAPKAKKLLSQKGASTRVRRFTRRSRGGCIVCKERKIKCCERRPTCKRCEKAKLDCIYAYTDEVTTGISRQAFDVPSGPYIGSEELNDISFWIETAGKMMGKWHCPYFWGTLLPRASHGYTSVKYALLAVSACTRQWYVSEEEDRKVALSRGLQYYRKACQAILQTPDRSRPAMEAALITSLALFCFDNFTDSKSSRYVHSNASLRILKSLKAKQSFNVVSALQTTRENVAVYPIIGTSESSFYDIKYPTHQTTFSHKNEHGLHGKGQTIVYTPMWVVQNEAGTTNVVRISSSTPSSTDENHDRVLCSSSAKAQQYISAWHCWLVTWVTSIAKDKCEISQHRQSVREWHSWLLDSIGPSALEEEALQNRALIVDAVFGAELNDSEESVNLHLETILRLTKRNLQLSEPIDTTINVLTDPPYMRGLPFMKGLLTTLEFVVRRTTDADQRSRAYKLMRLQC